MRNVCFLVPELRLEGMDQWMSILIRWWLWSWADRREGEHQRQNTVDDDVGEI